MTEEPYDGRLSSTVLGGAGGEIPPAYSITSCAAFVRTGKSVVEVAVHVSLLQSPF